MLLCTRSRNLVRGHSAVQARISLEPGGDEYRKPKNTTKTETARLVPEQVEAHRRIHSHFGAQTHGFRHPDHGNRKAQVVADLRGHEWGHRQEHVAKT